MRVISSRKQGYIPIREGCPTTEILPKQGNSQPTLRICSDAGLYLQGTGIKWCVIEVLMALSVIGHLKIEKGIVYDTRLVYILGNLG